MLQHGQKSRVGNDTSEKLCQGALKEESDGGFDVYSGGSGRTAGRGLGELGDCRACEKGEVKLC